MDDKFGELTPEKKAEIAEFLKTLPPPTPEQRAIMQKVRELFQKQPPSESE